MRQYKKKITCAWLLSAVMVMLLSLYVPHHHHQDSSCPGHSDCIAHAGHSHTDGCNDGANTGQICCSGGDYIDSKTADREELIPLIEGIDLSYMTFLSSQFLSVSTEKIYFGDPGVTLFPSPVISFSSLRAPPVC